jgi:hypothetical protein
MFILNFYSKGIYFLLLEMTKAIYLSVPPHMSDVKRLLFTSAVWKGNIFENLFLNTRILC